MNENTSAVSPTPANTTATITSPIVTGNDPQPIVSSPIVESTPVVEEAVVVEPTTPVVDSDPSKNTPEGVQKRINEITAKRYEAERNARTERDGRLAAEAKAAELLNQISKAGTETKPALTEDEIERRAIEKAQQIAAASKFNDACNIIVETGQKEFKDWDLAVKNLALVGAIGKDVGPEFLQNAIELKSPHKVLHYLGTNLEEAERIAKLSPTKMAMEMARVEAVINAPTVPAPLPPVSNAPAPVIPVGGAAKPGAPSVDDPNISTEQFMELRSKQAEEKRNRYRRA